MKPLYDADAKAYILPNGAPTEPNKVKPFLAEAVREAKKAGEEIAFVHEGVAINHEGKQKNLEVSICPSCGLDHAMDSYKSALEIAIPNGKGSGDINISSPANKKQI